MRILGFCIPVQLGLHFWPIWTIFLGRRIDYLSPTVYFTDCLALAAMIFWALSFLFLTPSSSRVWSKKHRVYIVLSAAVISIALLNIFNAFSWQIALYRWAKAGLFGFIVFYVASHGKEKKWYLRALIISALFSSIVAIVQFILQHSVGGVFRFLGERLFTIDTPLIARGHVCTPFLESCQLLLRPYATFAHPNVLGGYLSIALFLLVSLKDYIIKKTNKVYTNVVHYLVPTIIVAALFLSMSRVVIVTGAMLLVWRYVFRSQNKSNRLLQFGSVIVIGTLITGLLFVLPLSVSDESVLVRQKLNIFALSVIGNHWATGVGLGNFVLSFTGDRNVIFIVGIQPTHNVYLLALSEIGIVGVGGFFMILAYYYWHMKKYLTPVGIDTPAYGAALIALGFLGLFDHYLWSLQQGQLLTAWLIGLYLSSRFHRS